MYVTPRLTAFIFVTRTDVFLQLLTGATGSLGAHLLAQLLSLPHIEHVYCLVRADSTHHAQERINKSLRTRGLTLQESHTEKFTALASDLSRKDLGLGPEIYDSVRSALTLVIHSAWAVNFTLDVTSFESHHISGLYHLLSLCLLVPFSHPARLAFISSVSVAAGVTAPATVGETLVGDPAHTQNTGYAQSKWIAEHIVHRAAVATGMEASVFRVGQIVGDSVMGHWNASEAIPLLIRAATVIGALPRLHETVSWLPVDICARAITHLSGLTGTSADKPVRCFPLFDQSVVFHVVNAVRISWVGDVLPALRKAGLRFETVEQRKWVQLLREGEQDPRLNPTVKLLDFYANKYDNDKSEGDGIIFEIAETAKKSYDIRTGYDVVGNALIERCVECWRNEWDMEVSEQ